MRSAFDRGQRQLQGSPNLHSAQQNDELRKTFAPSLRDFTGLRLQSGAMRHWVSGMVAIRGVFSSFMRDRRGNVAVIFALSLPVLIGGAGLGVETSYWYFQSLQLQSSADAAAYAGELEKLAGSSTSAITAVASGSATDNGFVAANGTLEVFTPPSSGPNTQANAVEVILHQNMPRYFTAIFSSAPVVISARAVAKSSVTSMACMLALDGSASKALLFSGNANLSLKGCAVMSNSTAPDAIKVQGSAELEVECLIAAGGVDIGSGEVHTECSSPQTGTATAPDPFADLPAPAATSPCGDPNASVLQPGTFCAGLSLKGNVTLNSGVYVIQGGDFTINGNAVISGTGVTVYLACGAHVKMNGNAKVTLGAPTSGTYSGVLFFGDRNCTGGTNTFNGTADSSLTGAMYFAQQNVSYSGNFSADGGCTQVVAGTISWSGSTEIEQDCTSLGMKNIPARQSVQLVE